jgi:hypothetical protein
MGFTDKQLIFAAIFFVAFVVFIGLAYRKDLAKGKIMGQGVWKMLVLIAGTLGLFYAALKLAA